MLGPWTRTPQARASFQNVAANSIAPAFSSGKRPIRDEHRWPDAPSWPRVQSALVHDAPDGRAAMHAVRLRGLKAIEPPPRQKGRLESSRERWGRSREWGVGPSDVCVLFRLSVSGAVAITTHASTMSKLRAKDGSRVQSCLSPPSRPLGRPPHPLGVCGPEAIPHRFQQGALNDRERLRPRDTNPRWGRCSPVTPTLAQSDCSTEPQRANTTWTRPPAAGRTTRYRLALASALPRSDGKTGAQEPRL